MLGRIHSSESFSTIDGPGIRYVVFMQGCELRCKFCHNPDTWNKSGGKDITSDKLVEDILKGITFYKNSKGGVTFSGGEPLLQVDFLIEVCKKLKQNNIHVAIDTSGNFDINDKKIQELLKYIDLILLDIKHIDDKKCKWLTGVSNINTLNFVKNILLYNNIKLWIRIVYLPGITDMGNSLEKCRTFISSLKNVEKIEVLPYHEMGKFKWKNLGLKYELNNQEIPTAKQCKKIEDYLYSH